MTIKEALKTYPKIEADLLLSHVLNQTKEFVLLHPDQSLTETQEQEFQNLAKRREQGEPYAYLVGYKYFCGLKFTVTPDVLIPRPETEWLVEQAAAEIQHRLQTMKDQEHPSTIGILDMGTGSGCIAISIARQFANHEDKIEITGVDISDKALVVAQRNALENQVSINWVQSDLFSGLAEEKFDIIIANLPYVPLTDYKKLLPNLAAEPKSALTDQTNTWELYKSFLLRLPDHVISGATVLIETDPTSLPMLSPILDKATMSWEDFSDFNNLDRYIKINFRASAHATSR